MGLASLEEQIAEIEKEAQQYADYLSEDDSNEDVDAIKVSEKEFCNDFSNCIVVGGLPVVDTSKHAKLCNVIRKIFSQIGPIVDLQMPITSNEKTNGFAFLAYEDADLAANAIRTLHKFALDKTHTLHVNAYSDLKKYASLPEKYEDPPIEEFKEPKDLKAWLRDPERRDMFALRHGTESEIYWMDKGEITLDYDGAREKTNGKQWCSQYLLWSPQGTYLATFHPQGIALWAGEGYQKVARFAHKHVKRCIFSPEENYLTTVSETDAERAIIVWDIASSKILRAFPAGITKAETNEVVQGLRTPFKWSCDDRLITRRGKDVISVHELPSMQLLQKKSLKADGIHDFLWSPTDPILAYWAPEKDNVPARVSLVELPSRKELRQQNLFNVSDCKLHWHPNGTFLCVKVTRHSKSKKTLYTNFELFRIKEPLIPVEMLEMKDPVIAFAWEPKGSRFVIIHGESPTRASISFYDMKGGARSNEITLLYTLTAKQCSHVYWSPHGNNIVLAGLGEMNGKLEFWDTDEQQSITIQEHFKCTHVDWDPSGRVVMTAVCQPIDVSVK